MSKKSTSNLANESVALSLVAVGLLWAYITPAIFSRGTPYVAAILILVGFAGFMIELQKRFKNDNFRWDNGGIGILLGTVCGWLLFISYNNLSGWTRSIACSIISLALLIAFAAIIDFIVSVFEYFVQRQNDITGKLTGLLKFAALAASTIAAIYASLSQVI